MPVLFYGQSILVTLCVSHIGNLSLLFACCKHRFEYFPLNKITNVQTRWTNGTWQQKAAHMLLIIYSQYACVRWNTSIVCLWRIHIVYSRWKLCVRVFPTLSGAHLMHGIRYADVAAFNPNQNFSTQHTHTLLLFNQLWRSFYFVWFLISDAHSRPVTMCVPVQVCSIPTGYGCRWLLQININNNINIVVPCWFNLLVRLCVCAPSTGERILVAAAFHLLQFQLWIALVVRQRQRLRRWPCHNIIIFYLFTGELKVVENDTAP